MGGGGGGGGGGFKRGLVMGHFSKKVKWLVEFQKP